MSYLPYNFNQKLRNQQRISRRRRSPQNQYQNIKQSSSRRINSQSQVYYQQQMSPYPYTKPCQKGRKFIQQSVFLPSINKRPRQHDRRNSYGNAQQYPFQQNNQYDNRPTLHQESQNYQQQYEENIKTIDTQVETMQYLNECERIISNLKKLTNNPRNKPYNSPYSTPYNDSYKSSYNPTYIPRANPPKFAVNLNLPFSNYLTPDNHRNSIQNGNFQRQPSFFGSIQDLQQGQPSSKRQNKEKKINRVNREEKQSRRYKKNFQEEQQEQPPKIKRSKISLDQSSFTGRIKKNLNSQISQYDDDQLKVRKKVKKQNGKSTADLSNQFDAKSQDCEQSFKKQKTNNGRMQKNKNNFQEEDQNLKKGKRKNHKSQDQIQSRKQDIQDQLKQKSNYQKQEIDKKTVANKEEQIKRKDSQSLQEQHQNQKRDNQILDQSKTQTQKRYRQQQIENKQQQNENEIDYQKTAQNQKKLQQQLKKAQKRQKFLLKFLNKAKDRGSQLQRKITQHKSKLNQSRMTNKNKINRQKQKSIDGQKQSQENRNNKDEQKSSISPRAQQKYQNIEQNPEKLIYNHIKKQIAQQQK